MNNIKKRKIINIIINVLHLNSGHITPSTALIKELQIDEFDLEHIYAAIEKEFGISLVMKDFHNFTQINDFIDVTDESLILYQKL